MAVLQDCTPFQRYESQVYVAHNPENSRLSVVGSEPVLKCNSQSPKQPIWRRLKHARHSSTCTNTPVDDQTEREERRLLYGNNIGSPRGITGETCCPKTWHTTFLPVA
ncbi:hypothetical protein FOQG_03858 [Fusarium oxysporum f. sp. raphani 54005]|uniref:Uncharacterized protein n=2 Tax=Fusarium oxysporum TaxID=5507 RepID=X0CVB1_FUSOX|nr:hypothetical protein FOVG_10504 [Fusarium oxysporum f. sp. pisi HDV247]EXK95228.1 hypothetical protein FOQG_03858 [Fusarium oxysporum f. sp. raphani 54005]EXA38618.1 hypothetical protein FOVG_10504 [Fusarium oxysporum f. sp. pisi HDV247]EXA38619.1 hypothetical protein FOVG_10504 [Fusarium oxysporum f. sp. pisi HDV247]EXK95229.1 hypothetical protein FOQG_03858 [Fusarium oxysporum f. sp. raphani 54005]